MHRCPKCGRKWPFDGSWQQDNRCFGCGYGANDHTRASHQSHVSSSASSGGGSGLYWIIAIVLLFLATPIGIIMIAFGIWAKV